MSDSTKEYSFPQQMMTLSALAYVGENKAFADIKPQLIAQLARTDYATAGQWELVWGPCQRDETMFFCVRDKNTPTRFALVVRGTDLMDFDNWVEDLWVKLVPYPLLGPSFDGAPRVAHGTLLGLNQLTDMLTAQAPEAWVEAGQSGSLLGYLTAQAEPGACEITATGHSLGGCLALVLALWLAERLEKANVAACTFAAPTAGEADFARYAEARLGTRHHRYFNQLDVIPMAWNNLEGLKETPTKMGLIDDWFKLLLDGMIELTKGSAYTHPAHAFPISTESRSEGGWFHQAGYEHDYNTYLTILQAPTVKF